MLWPGIDVCLGESVPSCAVVCSAVVYFVTLCCAELAMCALLFYSRILCVMCCAWVGLGCIELCCVVLL